MPREKRFTCISVGRSVRDRLLRLREEVGARTWDELLEELLRAYREYRNFRVKKKILEVLCNHYKEASASPLAWPLIIKKHFTDIEEYSAALAMLQKMLSRNPRNPDEYTVDREKCREVQGAGV